MGYQNTKFFINNVKNVNGPSIFGRRLRQALVDKGWKWNIFVPDVSYIFATGFLRPFCKNILRLDGLYFDSENTVGDSDKLNSPIFNAYQKADGIIFQSQFDRQLFKNFIKERSCPYTVIHNGIPPQFSPEGEKVDFGYKKTLICSGRWRAHKRLDSIIEGFLEYGNPETGLIVLGWGIEKKVEHPNIQYAGKIPPEDLPKYLRGADAFIHLTWLDHCPNVVAEALGCGLPVLCTHNGGTKEIVKTNGIVIKCEEDYDFKKVPLYSPPECDDRIVAKGIEKILQWDKPIQSDYIRMDKIAQKYMDFTGNVFKT